MSDETRLYYLRIALIVFGLIFVFAVYPLTRFWPSGWSWGMGHSHYLKMILGIYATLGVFLLIASRDPLANRSLIWFTVWSSIVHGAIMSVQAIRDPGGGRPFARRRSGAVPDCDRAGRADAARRAGTCLERQPDVIFRK